MSYSTPNCSFKYRISFVDRVVDGDTIDIYIDLAFGLSLKKRLRLMGIDTPEIRTSDHEEKYFGILAQNKLKEWCTLGSEITSKMELRCPNVDPIDKYGRLLGELWILQKDHTWVNVNEWMCLNSYAVPYSGENRENLKGKHIINRQNIQSKM